MRKTKIIKFFSLILVVIMLCTMTGCFSLGDFQGPSNGPNNDPSDDDYAALFEDYYDAQEYFQNNSTIISKINATESSNIQSEADTYQNMSDRGFGECIVMADFDMSGEMLEDVAISDSSTDYHPSYTTTYVTSAGDIWTINEINGVVMAMPVSYNIDRDVPVIITETGTVTSYDLYGNVFYETIPYESAMIVKKVARIDAETLENLTAGEIDAL